MNIHNLDYPQSWYPVGLSKALKPLQHQPIHVFDLDWILFRTASGKIAMTIRHCCHLGTDLVNGKVVNEAIECPMHGWQFDVSGKCTLIPCQSTIPNSAKLLSLECEEHFGIIYAFWGPKPLFQFPRMDDLAEDLLFSSPVIVPLKAPSFTVGINTFDTQHYEKIHSRRFVKPPIITHKNDVCIRVDYTAEIIRKRWVDHIMASITNKVTTVSIESWGSSLMLLKNQDTHFGSVVGATPLSRNNCLLYIVALKEKTENQSMAKSFYQSMLLKTASLFLKSYLSPDLNVIANIKLHKGCLLDNIDEPLSQYFDYLEKLPGYSLNFSRNAD